MRRVESDALAQVARTLGLAGRGAQVTEFSDGQLDQVLDVAPIIRRSRTMGASEGIFTVGLQNVHVGASNLNTGILPFNVAVGAKNGYPVPVPADFDVWLLSAAVYQSAGAGTFVGALILDLASTQEGVGVNNSGVAASIGGSFMLALWDSIVVVSGAATVGLLESGAPVKHIGMRIPRAAGVALTFYSVASAAATFNCVFTLGIFPTGLGQDGLI